jgi:stringent starvation protein B
MSDVISTKPYLIRALHEWCIDNGFTPHLLVQVTAQTRVPLAFVKEGEIVLNINYSATKDLTIDNEVITFSARFSGVAQSLYIPIACVKGIFARETGQGMFFEPEEVPASLSVDQPHIEENSPAETSAGVGSPSKEKKNTKKAILKLVK